VSTPTRPRRGAARAAHRRDARRGDRHPARRRDARPAGRDRDGDRREPPPPAAARPDTPRRRSCRGRGAARRARRAAADRLAALPPIAVPAQAGRLTLRRGEEVAGAGRLTRRARSRRRIGSRRGCAGTRATRSCSRRSPSRARWSSASGPSR